MSGRRRRLTPAPAVYRVECARVLGWWVYCYIGGSDDWLTGIWFLTRRRAERYRRLVELRRAGAAG